MVNNQSGNKTARNKMAKLTHETLGLFVSQNLGKLYEENFYGEFRQHGPQKGLEKLVGFDHAIWAVEDEDDFIYYQKDGKHCRESSPWLLQYKIPTSKSTSKELLYDIEHEQFIRMLILEMMGFSAYYALVETDSLDIAQEAIGKIFDLFIFVKPSDMGLKKLFWEKSTAHFNKSTGELHLTPIVRKGGGKNKPPLFHVKLFQIINEINATRKKFHIPEAEPEIERDAYDHVFDFMDLKSELELENLCLCLHISDFRVSKLKQYPQKINEFLNQIEHSQACDEPDSDEDKKESSEENVNPEGNDL